MGNGANLKLESLSFIGVPGFRMRWTMLYIAEESVHILQDKKEREKKKGKNEKIKPREYTDMTAGVARCGRDDSRPRSYLRGASVAKAHHKDYVIVQSQGAWLEPM
jgi:hypothetical protein